MRLRPVLTVLKWPLGLAALGGLLAGVYLVHEASLARRAAEADEPPPKRAAAGVIKLGAEFAASHGLADEPARATQWARRVPAYGRVVPNPRAASEVRSAFPGTLRAAPDRPWPGLGTRVQAGELVGRVDVRVGPTERLDLLTKLNEAKARQKGAEELVRIQQDRLNRLVAAGGGVSQSEVDTAQAQLTDAKTQLATAQASVREWEKALDAISRQGDQTDAAWTQPLTAPAAGEVVELTGRPGMAVEPGGVVARVVDFRFALVRLEIPPEALAEGPPPTVELLANPPAPPALAGASNRPEPESPARPLPARLVGATPQVEVNSQYAAYWYEADTTTESPAGGHGVWRPGLFVKALLKVPGAEARAVVSVPATSLLYHQGRALVYVRVGPGRYERREVQVLGRDGDRWVLAGGVSPGEPVVSKRAQVLLSEEFRGEADTD
jgi:hypothetical protein